MARYAITGMSCLFPDAHTPEQFWQNLLAGRDSRRDGAQEIFGGAAAAARAYEDEHQVYCTRGGFVSDPAFDPTGYLLQPDYLAGLDRVFTWSLQTARDALRDAGQPAGDRTGLVLGNASFPTTTSSRDGGRAWWSAIAEGLAEAGFDPGDPPVPAGAPADPLVAAHNLWAGGMPPRVVSAALGLGGPHLAIDAACASALYAIKLACDYLATGAADVMLAGVVCAPDPLVTHLTFADLHAYPADGYSQPFDSRSRGVLTGQGAGMVVLMRLADAQAQGCQIHAVVDGVGLSNDGTGRHALAPMLSGQVDAYARAYAEAGVDPASVQYLECHATGTGLGDGIELAGIEQFFGRSAAVPYLGSVKSNIGHLLTAAGMAAVVKTILAMRHGVVPATIGVAEPIDSPCAGRIVRTAMPWPDGSGPRRAAVSSFGFGGTNAHLVLSAPAADPGAPAPPVPALPRLDIVGMGCHAGPYANVDMLERAVHDGETGFRPLPERRWRGLDRHVRAPAAPPDGGYVDGFDFDLLRYRLPPNDLAGFNEDQGLLTVVADEALRDAGYHLPQPARADGSARRVAVVVAVELNPFAHSYPARYRVGGWLARRCAELGLASAADAVGEMVAAARSGINAGMAPNAVLSFIGNLAASRISSLWNFTGPSLTVSADGTGAAAAFQVAQLLLLDPTVEAVLVGAVQFAGSLPNLAARSALGPVGGAPGLSIAGSGGWRPGDAAAAVVVTRAGDRPPGYATVDALAYGHARTLGMRADADGVQAVAQRALEQAGVRPEQVEYVELHATGLPEQDGPELAGLARIWPADRIGRHRIAIGAVSATVGDTQLAAQLLSVIKTALCLHHGYIPGVPAWTGPDERHAAVLQESAFAVPTQSHPWLRTARSAPRRALVSGLGTAGSRVSLLLSGGSLRGETVPVDWWRAGGPILLQLQARTVDALLDRLADAEQALRAGTPPAVLDRGTGGRRVVLCAPDTPGLIREIEAGRRGIPAAARSGREWTTPAGSCYAPGALGRTGKVALVYPGLLNAYPGLGADLFRCFPALLPLGEGQVEQPAAMLDTDLLYPRGIRPVQASDLLRTEGRMVGDFGLMVRVGVSFAWLATRALRDRLGVPVHGAVGYSMGESSMMCALGAWGLASPDAGTQRLDRYVRDQLTGTKRAVRDLWRIPKNVPDERVWSSMALFVDAEEVRKRIRSYDRVYLTHVNAPAEVVIGGDPEQCRALVADIGCSALPAGVSYVLHCPIPDEAELTACLHRDTRPVSDVELFSAAQYARIDAFTADGIAAGFAGTLRRTVDFPRLIRTLYDRGYRYFIEVGPGATGTRWIRDILADEPHVAESIDRRRAGTAAGIARVLARLAAHGVDLDLSALVPPNPEQTGSTAVSHRIEWEEPPVASSVAGAAAPIVGRLAAAPPEMPTGTSTPPEALPAVTFSGVPVWLTGDDTDTTPESAAQPGSGTAEDLVGAAADSARTGVAGSVHRLHQRALMAHRSMLKRHTRVQRQALEAVLTPAAAPPALAPLDATPAAEPVRPARPAKPDGVILDRYDLMELAVGKVSNVFGPRFAPVDAFARRVRLPDEPYFFVDRVTALEGETGRFEPSFIRSEWLVPPDAWFLAGGQVPFGVASEASQCSLVLVSYLGIDFENQGTRVYRLLDGNMVAHGPAVRAGQLLRFDIWIDQFIRTPGGPPLYTFRYKCYADGELAWELENGLAGFFTADELAQGRGIVGPELTGATAVEPAPPELTFKPLARSDRVALAPADITKLTHGAFDEVFGPEYGRAGADSPLRLPANRLLMIDEVVRLDPSGGRAGQGKITTIKRLRPDDWIFACHFPDDPVMGGTLIGEGAVQVLQVYAIYVGLHLCLPDLAFQPIRGLRTMTKIRGQIDQHTSEVRYELDIVDIGLLPRPYLVADVVVWADGKAVGSIRSLGFELRERPGTPYRPDAGGRVPAFLGRRNRDGDPALLGELHMAHVARGDHAMLGPEYEIYLGRKVPRLPSGDFSFADRLMRFDGERGALRPGDTLVCEYDVPKDAWYFADNGHPYLPNFGLLEAALQTAPLLAHYGGATLADPHHEFQSRNLEGEATLLRAVDLRGRTIQERSELLSINVLDGFVLQRYRLELATEGVPFYAGESAFCFASEDLLARNVGLDGGRPVPTWLTSAAVAGNRVREVDLAALRARRTGLRLPSGRLKFVDQLRIVPDGGEHAAGYLTGQRAVSPDDWYFRCHFYQDPVMPGSLGVESVLTALRAYVMELDLARHLADPVFAIARGVPLRWRYRGQVTPGSEPIAFEAHIKEVRRDPDRLLVIADGSVWRAGLRIYGLENVAIEVVSGGVA